MMNRRTVLGTAIILAATVAGQGIEAQNSELRAAQEPMPRDGSSELIKPAAKADKPAGLPGVPTSVPFELKDNLVRIEAKVNGRRQSAVLDSGAAALIVDQALIEKLGAKKGQAVGSALGAGRKSMQMQPSTLTSLEAGPLRWKNIVGYSVDLAQLSSSAGFPVDLLIGAPAFKYGSVTVDYPRRQLTFGPSASPRACAMPIPVEIINDAPVVELQLRPTPGAPVVRLKLLVDLGTRHYAVSLGGPFLRSEVGRALAATGASKQVGHGIGGKTMGAIVHVAELRLGMLDLGHPEVALTSNAPAFEAGMIDGSLGVPAWKEGVITFDYPARRLCIDLPPHD